MQQEKSYSQKKNYVKKQMGELASGDILLHPIYRADGLMVINKDTVLDVPLINKIKKHVSRSSPVLVATSRMEFNRFLVETCNTAEFKEDLAGLLNEHVDSDGAARQNSDTSPAENPDAYPAPEADTASAETNTSFLTALDSSPHWISLENALESEHLKERARFIKEELMTRFRDDRIYIEICANISGYDDVVLKHAINTLCISLVLGITLELVDEDLIELSVAALFVHVGYTELPRDELRSFLKSQEFSHPAMKKHMEAFLNATMHFPYLRRKSIIRGILEHHEFYNGNGYPNGKKGEEISLFGRILHIAHAYDRLVGGYDFTAGISPLQAIKLVYENKDGMFDLKILDIFMYRTTHFKLGQPIVLPNGRKGKIIGFENYAKSPHLPIVQLESGKTINLLLESTPDA